MKSQGTRTFGFSFFAAGFLIALIVPIVFFAGCRQSNGVTPEPQGQGPFAPPPADQGGSAPFDGIGLPGQPPGPFGSPPPFGSPVPFPSPTPTGTPTPTPIPSPSPFPSPMPTPTPSPAPIPSPTPTATATPKPSTTPTPTPTATPIGIAAQPVLDGYTVLTDSNPSVTLALTYDVSNCNAYAVYIELSRPNTPFINPNGTTPDPNRLSWTYGPPGRSGIYFYPSNLPAWGTYYLRIVPITVNGYGLEQLSNSTVLNMVPP